MTLLYREWHLIPRWTLRSIFAWFSEQLFKDLVSWGRPGSYSMIDHFLGDAFGVLSCLVLEYCSAVWCSVADTHLKLLYRVVRGARFLTSPVFTGDVFWQYSACCMRLGVIWCTIFMVLYVGRMCERGLHAVLWSHIRIPIRFLAAEPRSIVEPLFLSQCPCGTILLTLYSMVWDWRVSRAGPIFFIGLAVLHPTEVF